VKDDAQYFEELALSESPDALILMTPEGRILHWSRGTEAIFGYGRAQVLGHAIGELLIPTDRIAEEAQFLRETLEKGFAIFESVRRRQNGALLYIDVTSRVVHEPAGSTAFILHTEKDVTHLKVQRDAKLVEARVGRVWVRPAQMGKSRRAAALYSIRACHLDTHCRKLSPEGTGAGATQFIFRPIEPQELLAAVSGCLRERA